MIILLFISLIMSDDGGLVVSLPNSIYTRRILLGKNSECACMDLAHEGIRSCRSTRLLSGNQLHIRVRGTPGGALSLIAQLQQGWNVRSAGLAPAGFGKPLCCSMLAESGTPAAWVP